jgi:GT2 family glycosyltransferase
MTVPPRLSVIVVSCNTRADTLLCLRSLREHVRLPIEVLVADNDSRDGSAEAVRHDFPEALVLPMLSNVGFAAANNRALARTASPYVLFLNSDAEVRPGAIEALLGALEAHPEAALAGPRTLNADGTIQLSWGPALTPFSEWRQRRWIRGVARRDPRILARIDALARREHRPAWLSGSCLLARREALQAVCGFDEGYFLYEEDVDLCARLRVKGWEVLFVPQAEIVHKGGSSAPASGARTWLEYHKSHIRYYRRHNGATAVVLLRMWLLARATLGSLASRRGDADRSSVRHQWRSLAQLALGRAHPPAEGQDVRPGAQ